MKRPSVPDPKDAQQYKYVFDPMPMDEPPMDARTFNHYFHKPHPADDTNVWITRFPQLCDTSLFYNNERLAKGWGIEIIEDRNWRLFVCANVLALLASGAVAAVFSYTKDDRLTGVAIGAWLSTVQTLGITALLWHWTDQ